MSWIISRPCLRRRWAARITKTSGSWPLFVTALWCDVTTSGIWKWNKKVQLTLNFQLRPITNEGRLYQKISIFILTELERKLLIKSSKSIFLELQRISKSCSKFNIPQQNVYEQILYFPCRYRLEYPTGIRTLLYVWFWKVL